MTNHFILADPNKCIGCKTCELACVISHHNSNIDMKPEDFHPRLNVIKGMNITVPVMCRQCDNAPCANACPTHAIIRKANSIHVIQSLCIGCKSCVIACPFGAMTVVTQPQENTTATPEKYQSQAIKCDLCIDHADGPACIKACPTNTLTLIKSENIEKMISEKQNRTAQEAINLTFLQ